MCAWSRVDCNLDKSGNNIICIIFRCDEKEADFLTRWDIVNQRRISAPHTSAPLALLHGSGSSTGMKTVVKYGQILDILDVLAESGNKVNSKVQSVQCPNCCCFLVHPHYSNNTWTPGTCSNMTYLCDWKRRQTNWEAWFISCRCIFYILYVMQTNKWCDCTFVIFLLYIIWLWFPEPIMKSHYGVMCMPLTNGA